MKIKNYTSNSKNTFDAIQKILASHKARQVFFDYDDQGKVKGIAFSLEIGGKLYAFKLPARVDKVEAIFYREKKTKYDWMKAEPLTDKEKEQAYRTAWANIRDWIDAQLALVDTEMAKIEEVFLPYLQVAPNKSLFENMIDTRFQLSKGGEKNE